MRSPGTGVRDICTLDPLELELQAVVSLVIEMLVSDLGSSGRVASAPNHQLPSHISSSSIQYF